jgi:serine/threonine protein kinase
MLQLHQHDPPILHNDLKAANVLVDAGWHCKIADFNLSYMDGPAALICQSSAENPRWMAPEVPHLFPFPPSYSHFLHLRNPPGGCVPDRESSRGRQRGR